MSWLFDDLWATLGVSIWASYHYYDDPDPVDGLRQDSEGADHPRRNLVMKVELCLNILTRIRIISHIQLFYLSRGVYGVLIWDVKSTR